MVAPRGLAVITGSSTEVYKFLDNGTLTMKVAGMAADTIITGSDANGTMANVAMTHTTIAGKLGYDYSSSGLSATTVQAAVDE